MRSLTLTIRSLPSALLGGCTFGLAMLGDSGQPPLGDADTDADSDSDSDSDSDTDSDTDSDVEVTVDSITPAYGTTSGGTDVLITGTFDEDVSVRIDGVVA